MSRRPLRPCSQPLCPTLVESGRCVEHAGPKRPSPRQRGLDTAHEALAPRILERDRWICQLCQRPIDRSASPRAPMSASIDHIVPLSKGGTGDASNLRAAHYGCNSARGNRMEP